MVGTFAAGYDIGRVVIDPPVINITGPRKRVEAVENAITDPVDVSGTMERGTFVTHAYVSDPMVQVVDPAPIRVTVIMEKQLGREPGALISRSRMTSQARQLFGTDGIRGVAGEFPLTIESTYLIGCALGHDLVRSYSAGAGRDRPGHAGVQRLDCRSCGAGAGFGRM